MSVTIARNQHRPEPPTPLLREAVVRLSYAETAGAAARAGSSEDGEGYLEFEADRVVDLNSDQPRTWLEPARGIGILV